MTKDELVAIIRRSGWFEESDGRFYYHNHWFTFNEAGDLFENWQNEDDEYQTDWEPISYKAFLDNFQFPFLREGA